MLVSFNLFAGFILLMWCFGGRGVRVFLIFLFFCFLVGDIGWLVVLIVLWGFGGFEWLVWLVLCCYFFKKTLTDLLYRF